MGDRGSVTGIELVTRNSVTGLEMRRKSSVRSRNASVVSAILPENSGSGMEQWSFTFLRERFRRKNLEPLYRRYQQRLMHVNLIAYLVLQIVVSSLYIALVMFMNMEDLNAAAPEAVSHAIMLTSSVIFYCVFYKERINEKNQYQYLLAAIFLAFLLVATDIGLSVCLVISREDDHHVPAVLYTVLVVYNLLPIASISQATIVGVFVGAAHLTTFVLLFQKIHGEGKLDIELMFANLVFYLVANGVGIYSKVLSEITLRRAFLDRRSCIETTFRLDYEKNQEEKLMLSILPEYIAAEVRQDIRESFQLMNHLQKPDMTEKPFSKLYVEKHKDVTILFADIVNFTPLTVTLSVNELVKMLNDLFGKFDDAAEKNNCLRIKILGDCYYCVSGIPETTTEHAKNCAEMGLRMIEVIGAVREERSVNVDMRIGVHTGTVISGLMGIKKWQYDIWSRDVTIANRMEQSGVAGRVHVSKATKERLGDYYKFESGFGGARDSYLASQGIETFLIVPEYTGNGNVPGRGNRANVDENQLVLKADLQNADIRLNREFDVEEQMDNHNASVDFNESTDDDMYSRLPDEYLETVDERTSNGIGNLSLHRPSHMFMKSRKASLAVVGVEDVYADAYVSRRKSQAKRQSLVTGGIRRRMTVSSRRRSTESTSRRGAVALLDSTLKSYSQMMMNSDSYMKEAIETMPLTFSSQKTSTEKNNVDCLLFFSDRSWELPFLKEIDPFFKLYLFGALVILMGIASMQIILFYSYFQWFWLAFGATVGLILLILSVQWVQPLWDALTSKYFDNTNEFGDAFDTSPELPVVSCLYSVSKQVEESLAPRMIFFLLTTSAIAFCSVVDMPASIEGIFKEMDNSTILDNYPACQKDDPSVYTWCFTYSCALALTTGFLFYRVHFLLKFAFYLVALSVYVFGCMILFSGICEIEFVHRMDYIWQRRLIDEKQEANTTRVVNNTLLLNILPRHVADIYLKDHSNDELYHEEYDTVAVMFASIPNYLDFQMKCDAQDEGIHSLELLNKIIAAFDALLYEPQFKMIEKIKIVGSTFMAACGLDCSKNDESIDSEATEEGSSKLILSTMVAFAAAMFRELDKINQEESQDFQLRIGIDYGPVIAGVVGAQKPLYDIWGDTVNMASRMDYTGDLGKIQVTWKTAIMLIDEGIGCQRRGETFVKGKGNIMTYWVEPHERNYCDSSSGGSDASHSSNGAKSDSICTSEGTSSEGSLDSDTDTSQSNTNGFTGCEDLSAVPSKWRNPLALNVNLSHKSDFSKNGVTVSPSVFYDVEDFCVGDSVMAEYTEL